MSTVGGWVALVGAITGALTAMGGVAALLVKRFPPRSAGLAADVAKMKTDLGACTADMRVLTDYVHDLREHIARGKPPPPPDWPKGLRL